MAVSRLAWASSRRRFTLENVRGGNINLLGLLCEADSRELAFAPAEEWLVPEGWGACKVWINADPGTTFDFVELPDTN